MTKSVLFNVKRIKEERIIYTLFYDCEMLIKYSYPSVRTNDRSRLASI